MSQADMEGRHVEVAGENPDPEEDCDLPDRHDGTDIEANGNTTEHEGPEDELLMVLQDSDHPNTEGASNSLIGTVYNSSGSETVSQQHLVASGESSNEPNSVVGAIDNSNQTTGTSDTHSEGNPQVCVLDIGASNRDHQNDMQNCDIEGSLVSHVENCYPSFSTDGQKNSSENNEDDENVGLKTEGDSFEQYEEGAAPECENELRQDATSESDRQTLYPMECESNARDENINPLVSSPDEGLSEMSYPCEDRISVPCEDRLSAPSANGCGAFSGDIEISKTAEDAPEAELESMNVILDSGQAHSASSSEFVSDGTEASSLLSSAKSEGNSPPSSSFDMQNVDPIEQNSCGGADTEIQIPECDRGNSAQLSVGVENNATSGALTLLQISKNYTDSISDQDESNHISKLDGQQVCDSSGSGGESHNISNDNQSTIELQAKTYPSRDLHLHTDNPNGASNKVIPASGNTSECGFSVSSAESRVPDKDLSPNPVLKDSPSSLSQGSLRSTPSPDSPSIPSNDIKSQSPGFSEASSQPDSIPTVKNPQESSLNKQKTSGSSSSSSNVSQRTSPAKAVAAALFHVMGMDSKFTGRDLALALQSDDEDDLMSELDAELLSGTVPKTSKAKPSQGHQLEPQARAKTKPPAKRHGASTETRQASNGLPSSNDHLKLKDHNRQLLEQLRIRDEEIARLSREQKSQPQPVQKTSLGPNSIDSVEDLYGPQIIELEKTIAQQGTEIKTLTEKLYSHDTAAKRTVLSLQAEMKAKVDQVTKMYEDCRREKDTIVVKFAAAEAKNMEAKRVMERSESKVRDAYRERDNMAQGLKAARVDRQKAVANFDAKCAEVTNLHKELEKMKEGINSGEYRIKWFQNKLKDELEAHKETKGNLEKTNLRLKEAREETELIRKECQAIVKRYQESEEIKSNSLDKELKMKESELQTHLQERSDTEELHQMVKQELESLKSQHKDTWQEVKTLRDKIKCLEDERQQNHSMIESYQEIMQKQKAENTEHTNKLAALASLDDDYKRAQTMIQSLDRDISELKTTNRDLQKDMDSCRERESKMLTLQSELSKANALLRSENTNLSNKATISAVEVESLNTQVSHLEQQVKELANSLESQRKMYTEKNDALSKALENRTKESGDFKQKWEDEMDNSKTLKRRHANNVKDLTRQLQQARRKLEAHEGKGDGGSMGSRTNSNGSLNSIDHHQQHPHQHQQHHHQQASAAPPQQEHPVITEQVEVDKNVLIERIVRLQKSHARKNEKLEFLGEHIQQLLEEIKKKTKIIQSYAVREEAGTLSSDDMDAHKSLLARKGGIMASMYSVHQQDGSMTLDLSLQINKKLQAVLEDTLLKNITLKENLDTLGEEIARLSQENRRLQLHLQDLEKRKV